MSFTLFHSHGVSLRLTHTHSQGQLGCSPLLNFALDPVEIPFSSSHFLLSLSPKLTALQFSIWLTSLSLSLSAVFLVSPP